MANQLTGKAFWVTDRFNDIDENKYEHSFSIIENVVIEPDEDDHMIQFFIPYKDYFERSYNINLIRKPIGTGYESLSGEVRINWEKFQNKKQFFLYGQWIEGVTYKWWAIIDK